MLARVADSLYWMNRYLERAEFSARLVSLQVQRLPVGSADEIARGWQLLFAGLGADPSEFVLPGALEDDDYLFADGYTLTDLLTFETGNPGSILNCMTAARENAREVRSSIGPRIWSCLNREYLKLRETRLVDVWKREPELLYRDIAEGVERFHGVCDTSMRHGEAWSFMQLGKYVERAQLVGSLLAAHCGGTQASDQDDAEWPVLLRACNAFEAYGHEYGGAFEQGNILQLLVHEAELPFSLRFCLQRLHSGLDVIDPAPPGESRPTPFAILHRLDDLLDSYAEASSGNEPPDSGGLAPVCRQFREFHDALERSYVYYPVNA